MGSNAVRADYIISLIEKPFKSAKGGDEAEPTQRP